MARKVVHTCDICKEDIENPAQHINAAVYAVDFHVSCFSVLNPEDVLKVLELDEIKWMGEKLIYSGGALNAIRANRTQQIRDNQINEGEKSGSAGKE